MRTLVCTSPTKKLKKYTIILIYVYIYIREITTKETFSRKTNALLEKKLFTVKTVAIIFLRGIPWTIKIKLIALKIILESEKWMKNAFINTNLKPR